MDVGRRRGGGSERGGRWSPAAAAGAAGEREEALGPPGPGRQAAERRGDAGLPCALCTGTGSSEKRLNGPHSDRTDFCSREPNGRSAGSCVRQSKVNR